MRTSPSYQPPSPRRGSKIPITVDGSGGMFDRIAPRYDRLNRLMSMGMDRRWRKHLTRSLFEGPTDGPYKVLDLATGTADVAIDIARRWPSCRVTGLDPSQGMLDVGRTKIDRLNLSERVKLINGDAQALPFESGDFDAASIAFGIRNVPDRQKALNEMARVIRPGGRVAILELCEPRGGLMSGLARFHVRHVVPRLGAWLSGAAEYRYLQQSMAAFPQPNVFVEMMETAGLSLVSLKRFAFGAAHLFVGQR